MNRTITICCLLLFSFCSKTNGQGLFQSLKDTVKPKMSIGILQQNSIFGIVSYSITTSLERKLFGITGGVKFIITEPIKGYYKRIKTGIDLNYRQYTGKYSRRFRFYVHMLLDFKYFRKFKTHQASINGKIFEAEEKHVTVFLSSTLGIGYKIRVTSNIDFYHSISYGLLYAREKIVMTANEYPEYSYTNKPLFMRFAGFPFFMNFSLSYYLPKVLKLKKRAD